MADDGESLESWLNKATNPSNRQEDWEYIMGFCDQINKELEGPQISVRLLAHKIQSPQEWEAIQALTTLEACMKNCGQRFHNEVGKFRFLNELIKVVSPKYLGEKVSERVKTKVIEMLYSWTVSLPDEAKICEAYQMLKTQGIVLTDPDIPLDATLTPSPSPRPKNPVFDDEEKSRRLAVLLKSKKPEDLQEANRLIKNMVKEDEVRAQKATKQKSTLEAVNNSVKLLNEMLVHFSSEDSTDADKELIKELYTDCDKLRQTVWQLATETEDNDNNLGDILQASDDLSHVINTYKKIVEGQTINGGTEEAHQSSHKQGSVTHGGTNHSEILIDLVGLDTQTTASPEQQPQTSSLVITADLMSGFATTDLQSMNPSTPSAALSLLDEELLSLGLSEHIPDQNKSTAPTHVNLSSHLPSFQDSSQDVDLFDPNLPPALAFSTSPLLTDAVSIKDAPVSTVNSLSTVSNLSLPDSIFSTLAVSSQSVSASSFTNPQLLLGPVFTNTAKGSIPQSYCKTSSSLSSTVPTTTHIPPQLISTAAGPSQSASPSLIHNLPDLAQLDLGSPKNLLVKDEDVKPAATHSPGLGVTSKTSDPLVREGQRDGSPLSAAKSQADDSPLLRSLSPILPLSHTSPGRGQDVSLANVFVPLETIRPSKMSPVTAYDKSGVRVLLHFATDCPPGRPDVLVMVASMLNTAPLPVRNVVLQAAVPKTMKVRLQPPSGTELAPFNPILPPAAITQVMLLANPLKEKVRMRYKLTFTLGESPHTEVGEVSDFPPADRWGAL
ncbi:ADP-ribosylation factor-binding protein GGA3a isoform X2 [Sphaeramia orbicularis]|uniref:ADP-ribosylation factor-binding protein GGA3a isoform X2 n=1 Tax=Sphaeramia orbicularis TaxID=375764 RepID=UPI00117F0E59|nr:ADP-ribosylation factor-binding protein GGA3-like isoform X2 [Sphaeramia orbicularis]